MDRATPDGHDNAADVQLRVDTRPKAVPSHFPRPVAFNIILDDEGQHEAGRRYEQAADAVYVHHDQHPIAFPSAPDSGVLDDAFKANSSGSRGAPLVVPVGPATIWAWCEPDNPNEVRCGSQHSTIRVVDADRLFRGRRVPKPEDVPTDCADQ